MKRKEGRKKNIRIIVCFTKSGNYICNKNNNYQTQVILMCLGSWGTGGRVECRDDDIRQNDFILSDELIYLFNEGNMNIK